MTARDQADFATGVETTRQMAMTAAVTIKVRDDAGGLRQRAAVAALQGMRTLALQKPMEPSRENS